MLTRRHLITASTAGLVSAATGFLPRALAQGTTPAINKPVRVIVGFPAGGGTDVIARILADRLRGPYASTVLVENKPGAAARLAVEFVKNSEPDGSTMLFTPDFPITVYPHSFRSLNYDSLRDFTPVSPAAKSMLTYNVGPAVPEGVKTVADFIQWCKANPAKAAYGTTAAGGTPHFVGLMLANEAGVPMSAVHYRGGAPALQDLIGGHVPASVNPISESMTQAKAGTIRILAVTGAKRSSFLPDVPTMTEAGFNVVVESWLGGFVPSKTPPEIVNALGAAIREAVQSPQMIENLSKVGNEPWFMTPADFAAKVKADVARWGPVVKASGFVAED
jgi:tripartite-type tricarboxylate transporter receptor subunit TctC